MTITYKLEPHDLRTFQRFAQKHLPSVWRAHRLFWAAMVAFSLWLTFSSDDRRLSFRIAYFCVLMLLFWLQMRFWMFVVVRVMEWRSFTSDKHKSVICEHTVTLADDALVETTPFNEGRNRWGGIYQIVETTDYIYIYISIHSAHIIPKRAFTDAESARSFYEKALSLRGEAQRVASS